MQNHVTPGTARRLRDAGFPQPEPEFGQIWHPSRYGGLFVYICKGCGNTMELRAPAGWSTWEKPGSDKLFFAPTAADILRELPDRYVLWHDDSQWYLWFPRRLY